MTVIWNNLRHFIVLYLVTKTIHRTLVTILSLTVSTCLFAQKDKSFYLNWHDKGHDNITFQSSELKYSEKGKFYYNLSNDRENLYIDLKVARGRPDDGGTVVGLRPAFLRLRLYHQHHLGRQQPPFAQRHGHLPDIG
jgi:hypothetical protein